MFKKALLTLGLIGFIGMGVGVLAPTYAGAAAKDEINNALNKTNDGNTTDLNANITRVINLLLFIIGAVAVIMIIIGGIKYVTSNGDQGSVQSAKNTIMYAVIGLIVAIIAYAIVNFVVTTFTR
jgi:magnesium-transporting ATPase (P-type)